MVRDEDAMATRAAPVRAPLELLRMGDGLIVQQSLCVAATLGIADLLGEQSLSAGEIALRVEANEDALYRILRLLASQGVFEETAPRRFANNTLSQYLRTAVPGSLRAMFIFRGRNYYFAPFQEILHSVGTGRSARDKVQEMSGWEFLRRNPEEARIFDDAMTSISSLLAPAIVAAYDFARWESLMDVGGGNGILLASILEASPGLRGVLADQPEVINRARKRPFLAGELRYRVSFQECNFFDEVPSGCRAYLMKNVIHDWDDARALQILKNCRRAVPSNGVLLLVEYCLTEDSRFSLAKAVDVAMLVLTGGKERMAEEFRQLLADAGFCLNRVISTEAEMSILEALPA